MISFDFGNSQANVSAITDGLNKFSGDLRSTRSLLQELRDKVAIPSTKHNFATSGTRSDWALHPATYTMPRRRGGHGGPPLFVRGTLFRAATAKTRWTIDGQASNLFVAADTFQASNAPYGRMQHEGGVSALTGGPVPSRPFYEMDIKFVAKAESVVQNWIWRNFDKRIGVKAAATTVGSVTS